MHVNVLKRDLKSRYTLVLKVKASPGLEANLLSTRTTKICTENIPRQKV